MTHDVFTKVTSTIIFILLLASIGNKANAQCLNFAKNIGKPKLENFVHDGNYNATILGAGETAELYKTFFKGQKYRIAISKIDNLPDIHFRLIDEDNNILFDNKDHNYTDVWDFSIETTQMLMIQLKVMDNYNDSEMNTTKGCVSVLFGIEKDK
jgi:hypothetical protein